MVMRCVHLRNVNESLTGMLHVYMQVVAQGDPAANPGPILPDRPPSDNEKRWLQRVEGSCYLKLGSKCKLSSGASPCQHCLTEAHQIAYRKMVCTEIDGDERPLYTPLNSTVKSCGWVHCAVCRKCFSAKTNKIGNIWKHTETFAHFEAVQKQSNGPASHADHEEWLLSAGLQKRGVVDKEARAKKKVKLTSNSESENGSANTELSAPTGPTARARSVQNEPQFTPLARGHGAQLPQIWSAFNVSGLTPPSQRRA